MDARSVDMRLRCFLLAGVFLLAGAVQAAKNAPYLLIGGSGWNEVALLDKEGQRLVWSYPIGAGHECNSVDVTRRGEVLFAYRSGAKLVSPTDNRVIWDFPAPEGCELHTARVLPDGGFLLAWCGLPAGITELDRTGRVRKSIRFDTDTKSVHGQFRLVTKLKNGHYLVPLMSQGCVLELDGDGHAVRRVKTGGGPFGVTVLKNKNWLVSCGDAHFLTEIDPASGLEVLRIGQTGIAGVSFQFAAQVSPAGDRLFIANWLGHSRDKAARKLIEVDRKRQLLWSVNDELPIPNVSTVCPVYTNIVKGK